MWSMKETRILYLDMQEDSGINITFLFLGAFPCCSLTSSSIICSPIILSDSLCEFCWTLLLFLQSKKNFFWWCLQDLCH